MLAWPCQSCSPWADRGRCNESKTIANQPTPGQFAPQYPECSLQTINSVGVYIYDFSSSQLCLRLLVCVYIYTHTLIILTLLYSCFDLNLIFEFRHQSNEFMNANVYDPQYFNHMQPQAYSLLRYLLCN